jgi:hypothetical protein
MLGFACYGKWLFSNTIMVLSTITEKVLPIMEDN